MSKKAVIILADGFEEIEAVTSIDILRRAGIEVIIAGLSDLNVKGSHGITVVADTILNTIEQDINACILPGGMPGAKNLASSEKLISAVKKMNEAGKIIAAICAAPAVVLAPAGVLENKTATCYPDMRNKFGKKTAYKEDNVVIDGNIITSRSAATALLFAFAIVEKLSGKEIAETIRKTVFLD